MLTTPQANPDAVADVSRIAALPDAREKKRAPEGKEHGLGWVGTKTLEGHALGPVASLLESLGYHHRHDLWRFLRRPISLSGPPHWHETLIVQVGAKRICASPSALAMRPLASPDGEENDTQVVELPPIEPPALILHGRPVHILRQEADAGAEVLRDLLHGHHEPKGALVLLNELVQICGRFNRCQRRVAAAALSTEGLITRIALNYPWLSHVWHAEWVLVRGEVEDGKVPACTTTSGAFAAHRKVNHNTLSSPRILSTLKPCRMCAALITRTSFLQGHIPQVYYSTFDPGRSARQTVLDAHSPDRTFCMHHCAGAPGEKPMAARAETERFLGGQWERQISEPEQRSLHDLGL